MRELRRPLKSFIQMTATPAAEGYQKLFSQRWLMDTGDLWGNAITHWRDEHFTYNSKTYSYKLRRRSEEHTSELQSLMRISYAVFCLKKKKTHTRPNKSQADQ